MITFVVHRHRYMSEISTKLAHAFEKLETSATAGDLGKGQCNAPHRSFQSGYDLFKVFPRMCESPHGTRENVAGGVDRQISPRMVPCMGAVDALEPRSLEYPQYRRPASPWRPYLGSLKAITGVPGAGAAKTL